LLPNVSGQEYDDNESEREDETEDDHQGEGFILLGLEFGCPVVRKVDDDRDRRLSRRNSGIFGDNNDVSLADVHVPT
jgi:hypothetical protein